MAPGTAAAVTQGTLDIVPLGHDVYACIGASGGSNTGFIVGRRGVLVVDTRPTTCRGWATRQAAPG